MYILCVYLIHAVTFLSTSSWIADPNFCCTFSSFKTPVEQVASRYVKTVLVSGEYIFTGDYCCLASNHKRSM